MTILIPSYEPDDRLLALVRDLKEARADDILIVDDGSGERYRGIFDSAREAGCTVLTHRMNQGKGRALKTGFDYIRRFGDGDGVVCADSDGQHLPGDITRVAAAVREHRGGIVLGSRRFTGKVPLRSRVGNSATRIAYACATGTAIQDTQTGLRGYPPELLDWLCEVPGDRFEYEMNVLLEAPRAGIPMIEVPIDTVYLDGNESSHFRPLADSARIYYPFLKFCASSGFAAIVDFALLFLLQGMSGSLLFAVIGGRLCSSILNYAMNREYVFSRRSGGRANGTDEAGLPVRRSATRYFSLALVIVASNYGILHALHETLGVPLLPAKLSTEAALFLLSYGAQRKFVY